MHQTALTELRSAAGDALMLGRPRGGFIRRRGGLVFASGGKAPALVGFADGVAPDLGAMAGSGANLAGLVLSQGCPNERLQRTRRASANGAEHSPGAAEPPAVSPTERGHRRQQASSEPRERN